MEQSADNKGHGENHGRHGRLTTHVLDTTGGCPAEAVKIDLFHVEGETKALLSSVVTNADGRVNEPLLEGENLKPGVYELLFHAGDYLKSSGVNLPDVPFLDLVPIRFGVFDSEVHYHVPLLISPYGYSTYRGS